MQNVFEIRVGNLARMDFAGARVQRNCRIDYAVQQKIPDELRRRDGIDRAFTVACSLELARGRGKAER